MKDMSVQLFTVMRLQISSASATRFAFCNAAMEKANAEAGSSCSTLSCEEGDEGHEEVRSCLSKPGDKNGDTKAVKAMEKKVSHGVHFAVDITNNWSESDGHVLPPSHNMRIEFVIPCFNETTTTLQDIYRHFEHAWRKEEASSKIVLPKPWSLFWCSQQIPRSDAVTCALFGLRQSKVGSGQRRLELNRTIRPYKRGKPGFGHAKQNLKQSMVMEQVAKLSNVRPKVVRKVLCNFWKLISDELKSKSRVVVANKLALILDDGHRNANE